MKMIVLSLLMILCRIGSAEESKPVTATSIRNWIAGAVASGMPRETMVTYFGINSTVNSVDRDLRALQDIPSERLILIQTALNVALMHIHLQRLEQQANLTDNEYETNVNALNQLVAQIQSLSLQERRRQRLTESLERTSTALSDFMQQRQGLEEEYEQLKTEALTEGLSNSLRRHDARGSRSGNLNHR